MAFQPLVTFALYQVFCYMSIKKMLGLTDQAQTQVTFFLRQRLTYLSIKIIPYTVKKNKKKKRIIKLLKTILFSRKDIFRTYFTLTIIPYTVKMYNKKALLMCSQQYEEYPFIQCFFSQ